MDYHLGFVMEQDLGHKTHSLNVAACVAEDPEVVPSWFPISTRDTERLLPVIGKNWTIRASLRARDLVRRELRSKRLSALFFHTQTTALFSAGLMRRIPSAISLDATPRNLDQIAAAYNHVAREGSPLEAAKLALHRRMFAGARLLITWNRWAKDSLVDDYKVDADLVHVIDPGVDLALWADLGLARPAARPRPKILFAGMDFARKGGPLLLQVFRDHFRDAAELHLITKAALDPEPGVTTYNDLTANHPDLRRLFDEADLFVLPSLGECSPRVIPEAMAARLPAISTRVGAIPELIDDGTTGYLIEPGDGAALRAAIGRLVADPSLRRSMGGRGRAVAEREFDARANNRRLLALLKGIARPEPSTAGRRGSPGVPVA